MATLEDIIKNKVHISNKLARIFLAECFGTFMLIILTDASSAQAFLSGNTAGNFITAAMVSGLAVTVAVYSCGGVSGGHINPAVTVAFAVVGRTEWIEVPFYLVGQYIGAFWGAACVHGVYLDAFDLFDKNVPGAAGIFAPYPRDHLSIPNGFFDQIFGTAILLICVMALADERNMKPPKGTEPILIGSIVMGIAMSLGFNCGNAINPARDLGPRLYSAIAGWGTEVFTYRNWPWVPVVGSHIGAIIGSMMYLLLVGLHTNEKVSVQ